MLYSIIRTTYYQILTLPLPDCQTTIIHYQTEFSLPDCSQSGNENCQLATLLGDAPNILNLL